MDKDPDKLTDQSVAGIEVIKQVNGRWYQKSLQITLKQNCYFHILFDLTIYF